MIYFGIPTYKRSDKQPALEYLESVGVKKEQIIMSVQTEEDNELYRQKGYDKRVGKFLFRPAENVSGNTNTIFRNAPANEKIVILDDDIKTISKLSGKDLVSVDTPEKFEEFLAFGYAVAFKLRTIGFSVYPCNNPYFMSPTYNETHIGEGTLLALTNIGLEFDESYETKSDYELTCRIIEKFGKYPRLNMYSCKAPHFTKGGCEGNWENKKRVMLDAKRLVERHPGLVKENGRRPGEVLMVPRRDKRVVK